MTHHQSMLKFMALPDYYICGCTVLDFQRHRVGGTSADRRLRELRALGLATDIGKRKTKAGGYIKEWFVTSAGRKQASKLIALDNV